MVQFAERHQPRPVETNVSEDAERLEDLARKAYTAYGQATGGKNYQGLPMPAFDDLGDTIQHAWKAAVQAVDRDWQQWAGSLTEELKAVIRRP